MLNTQYFSFFADKNHCQISVWRPLVFIASSILFFVLSISLLGESLPNVGQGVSKFLEILGLNAGAGRGARRGAGIVAGIGARIGAHLARAGVGAGIGAGRGAAGRVAGQGANSRQRHHTRYIPIRGGRSGR